MHHTLVPSHLFYTEAVRLLNSSTSMMADAVDCLCFVLFFKSMLFLKHTLLRFYGL